MSTRFVALDLMRIFAAAAVMVFHLGFWSWVAPTNTPGTVLRGATSFPELAFLWWGRYGVEIFFVISGFVIAFSASQSSACRFAANRFLRLFPTALICASITMAAWVLTGVRPASDLIAMYTRTIFFDPYGPWIDGVYWTLGIEIVFYSVVAASIALGLTLERVCFVIGLYSSVMWVFHYAGYFDTIYDRTPLLLLCAHGVYFALGATIWSATNDGWTGRRKIVAAGFSAIGYLAIVGTAGSLANLAGEDAAPHWAGLIWLAAVLFIGGGSLIDAPVQRAVPPRILRIVRSAGLATYPLYLLHDVVGAALLRCGMVLGANRWVSLLLTMTILFGIASFVTTVLEPRLRDFIRSVIYRAPAANQEQ